MLQTGLIALGLAAVTLAISGCGESSKTTSSATAASTTASQSSATTTAATTTAPVVTGTVIKIKSGTPLTRAAMIAKADAICAATNAKRTTSVARTQQDIARLMPQSAAYDRAEAVQLSKLVPPTSLASDWERIVDGIQKVGEYSTQVAEAARTNKFSLSLPELAAGNTAQRQVLAIATRDGFKHCSLP